MLFGLLSKSIRLDQKIVINLNFRETQIYYRTQLQNSGNKDTTKTDIIISGEPQDTIFVSVSFTLRFKPLPSVHAPNGYSVCCTLRQKKLLLIKPRVTGTGIGLRVSGFQPSSACAHKHTQTYISQKKEAFVSRRLARPLVQFHAKRRILSIVTW